MWEYTQRSVIHSYQIKAVLWNKCRLGWSRTVNCHRVWVTGVCGLVTSSAGIPAPWLTTHLFKLVFPPSALPSRCTFMEKIIRQVLLTDWLLFSLILAQTCNDAFKPFPGFQAFCVVPLFFHTDLGFWGYLYLLQDENDNPPEFSKSSYIVKIPENINAGEYLTMFWDSRVFFFLFPPASAALLVYILHNVLNCLVRMQDVEELQCCIHSHACIERTLILDNRLVSGRQREMGCLTAPTPIPLLSELEETLAPVLNSGWRSAQKSRLAQAEMQGSMAKVLGPELGAQGRGWSSERTRQLWLASHPLCLPGYWSCLCQVLAVPNMLIIL